MKTLRDDDDNNLVERLEATLTDLDHDNEDDWDIADAEEAADPLLNMNEMVAPTHRREANKLNNILEKLDFVIRRITRSSSWRHEYNRVMKARGLSLGQLIAGYGIQWNIKYISRHKAWQAREVIDQLLKEDLERVHSKTRGPRKNGKAHGYFHKITISPSEWASIQELNSELEPFLTITKQMAGNMPTGAMVIPQYVDLRATLQAREHKMSHGYALYPMLAAMISKLQVYLDEALACETLVMATILHPAFRLQFFERHFEKTSATYIKAESTFNQIFKDYQEESTQ